MSMPPILNKYHLLIDPVLKCYPDAQAIYLFGSYDTENEWPNSDIDIAVLLPIETAKRVTLPGWAKLSSLLTVVRDKVDLVNLRKVNTVFCKEIVTANRRIYCADENAADEFEMLTLSLYQQLQYERKGIIDEAVQSGSILHA